MQVQTNRRDRWQPRADTDRRCGVLAREEDLLLLFTHYHKRPCRSIVVASEIDLANLQVAAWCASRATSGVRGRLYIHV